MPTSTHESSNVDGVCGGGPSEFGDRRDPKWDWSWRGGTRASSSLIIFHFALTKLNVSQALARVRSSSPLSFFIVVHNTFVGWCTLSWATDEHICQRSRGGSVELGHTSVGVSTSRAASSDDTATAYTPSHTRTSVMLFDGRRILFSLGTRPTTSR